jgi:hypothetical protein
VRTALVKAATEQPLAVIADVNRLVVPAPSAWAVLTSAQWLTAQWPAVPICGVSADAAVRQTLLQQGILRYVPFFDSRAVAAGVITAGTLHLHYRRRAQRPLPRHDASAAMARAFVRRTLSDWSRPDYIDAAVVIVTELVENVLAHTESRPQLRLELSGNRLTVVVADDNQYPAVLHETAAGTSRVSGLGMVSRLASMWGCNPGRHGKAVWAVIRPRLG